MDVDAEVARIATMPVTALRERWQRLIGTPVPKVSTGMLRLALAWEMQSTAYGGVPRAVTRALDQLEKGLTRTQGTTPGMRLVREWGGRVHVVTISEATAQGTVIRWNDQEWRSLSEVARAITGTRWSGPAFFGLKKKAA